MGDDRRASRGGEEDSRNRGRSVIRVDRISEKSEVK